MAKFTRHLISTSETLEVEALQRQALDKLGREVLQSFDTGNIAGNYNEFVGLTRREIRDRFDFCKREAEYHAILTLLARTEAEIREDFANNRANQLAFMPPHQNYGSRVRFSDILDSWKLALPNHTTSFGELKGALRLRHWLAHGRSWDVNLARAYTISDINFIVNRISLLVQSH